MLNKEKMRRILVIGTYRELVNMPLSRCCNYRKERRRIENKSACLEREATDCVREYFY